jgi:hypothetical protein
MASQKDRRTHDSLAETVRQQQHTGNHDRAPGDDRDPRAGTRAGAENVEPSKPGAARKS